MEVMGDVIILKFFIASLKFGDFIRGGMFFVFLF